MDGSLIKNGLSDAPRKAVVGLLQPLLADEVVLSILTRNAHWNVTGPDFSTLHLFFEKQYDDLDVAVDEVAERIRMIGGIPAGSLTEFSSSTRLNELNGAKRGHQEWLGTLLESHQIMIRQLREDVEAAGEVHGDQGTSDLLSGLLAKHEKWAWMLRASITK